MDTVRVDIAYRPLRVAFLLTSNDLEGFRKVARLCFSFWGGAYNPIIAVDRPEADNIVEIFRPDFLVKIGDDPAIAHFAERYSHLIDPLWGDGLFFPPSHGREGRARLLDLENMIIRMRGASHWNEYVQEGVCAPNWDPDDPLADMFLAQYGAFPDPAEIGIDYSQIVSDSFGKVEQPSLSDGAVPTSVLDNPRISNLGRFGLEPHYSSNAGWIYPGVYIGDSKNCVDLINFWNLRACGTNLLFSDINYPDRTCELQTKFIHLVRDQLSGRGSYPRTPAIWAREEFIDRAKDAAGKGEFTICSVDETSWNGLNIRPLRMHFGQETSLGVIGGNSAQPRVTFALKEKPFSGETWFHTQHLVASISLMGVRSDGANYTFAPPCIPELNEFAARTMHHRYDRLRLEHESVGVVIDATEKDIGLSALPVPALLEQIFALAQFSAKPSSSGLVTRQLITRMGGLDGARAFKIPGVRSLIKTYGPSSSFSKKGALQLIASPDPVTGSKFSDHLRLFIEPREIGTNLTPPMVFSHLVEKDLFRIGADLKCPACALTSWTPLDTLRQQAECPLCGNDFDATRQLVDGDFAYRRSGILGIEKNTLGAIPVALLLQQLHVNLSDIASDHLFGISHDLIPKEAQAGLPTCETDFCVIAESPRSRKTTIVIGECKDSGGEIDENDITNLRIVADAFPKNRFEVYIILAKLSPFTETEVELARSLNEKPWQRRAILLTARELEPYHVFERTNADLGLSLHGSSIEDLANATDEIYFIAKADPDSSDADEGPAEGSGSSHDQDKQVQNSSQK